MSNWTWTLLQTILNSEIRPAALYENTCSGLFRGIQYSRTYLYFHYCRVGRLHRPQLQLKIYGFGKCISELCGGFVFISQSSHLNLSTASIRVLDARAILKIFFNTDFGLCPQFRCIFRIAARALLRFLNHNLHPYVSACGTPGRINSSNIPSSLSRMLWVACGSGLVISFGSGKSKDFSPHTFSSSASSFMSAPNTRFALRSRYASRFASFATSRHEVFLASQIVLGACPR